MLAVPRLKWPMASVLYRCSTTGMNVQAWFDDDAPADDSLTYVSAMMRSKGAAVVRRASRATLPPWPATCSHHS